MDRATRPGVNPFARLGEYLVRHSGKVILAGAVITLLLMIPLIALSPDEDASSDPGGDVFELQDDIDDRFESFIHSNGYIVEARDGGDILTQAALLELYENTQELLAADERGELAPEDLPAQPYFYAAFDTDTNRPFVGLNTIADEVQRVLQFFGTSLESATDDQVKLAIHLLFTVPETSALKDFLSIKARSEKRVIEGQEIEHWTSPALIFRVMADNEKLGGGSGRGIGADESDLDKENFNRNVQRVLRGEERTYRLWGIAIDLNLEAEDEGRTVGIFVMFTVIAAVVVVGIALRSYWAMALTGVGLGALMIWLKGISDLVGLKGGTTIELIVPIAMIALGVDFAVHAIRRYQEERAIGYAPRRALQIGFAGVLGALVLAMLSDGIAFLSNAASGIEAIIHFGIAAAIAAASSFLVLGVIVPLAAMRIDQLRRPHPGSASLVARIMTLTNGAGVAALTGTSVLFLVVGWTIPGVVILLATIVGFLVIPTIIMRWRNRGLELQEDSPSSPIDTQPTEANTSWLVPVVTGLARYRSLVLLVIAGITAASALLALRLDPEFDVKDFFDSNSDFVVGLDKLDEHIAERSGEPGIIYIKGDLTDLQALAATQQFVGKLAQNPYVGRNADGEPSMADNIFSVLERITGSAYARDQITQASGVEITDVDGDGIPDSKEQVKATYDYISQNGVPLNETTLIYDVGQVRDGLFHDPSGGEENVTVLIVGIPGSREQTVVKAAREALTEDLEVLRQNPLITRVGVTGSPFVREGQLGATTNSLQTSLPIAAAAALVLLLLTMRSLRYAVVTVIPIGLVVVWLFALMYLIGFSLNLVTATIGAISIGVGIDYSIHMTERFREELQKADNKMQALRQAANGTGMALVASAVSSIVGFTILGFAPMPMFSSFGFLTAIMIFLALAASLVVLPSLLLLVTSEKVTQVAPSATTGKVQG